MAEQDLGGFKVGLDQQTMDMIASVGDSAAKISEHMELAGVANEVMLEYMQELSTNQKSMVEGLQTYQAISMQIIENTRNLTNVNRDLLGIQTQAASILIGKTAEEKKQLDIAKQKKELETSESKKNEEDPLKNAEKKGESFVRDLLSKVLGPVGATIAMAGFREAGQVVSDMRNITRTGGMGMSEGLGVANSASMEASMRFASLPISFLKESYGSKQEMQQGAATMFGSGGIRGDALAEMMTDLPRLSWEAGMRFSDTAMVMAKTHRILQQSPRVMETAFTEMTDSARAAGEHIGDWVKGVTAITLATAAYGADQMKVNRIVEDNFHLIKQEKITREQLQAMIVNGFKARMTEGEIIDRINTSAKTAGESLMKMGDEAEVASKIQNSIIDVTVDQRTAIKRSAEMARILGSEAMEGAVSLGSVTTAAKDLTSHFGSSEREIINFAMGLEKTAKEFNMSGPELVKHALTMSKSLLEIGHNQKDALSDGAEIAKVFAGDLKTLDITANDLSSMLKTMTSQYNMSREEVEVFGKVFIDIGKATNAATADIKKWQEGMASGVREMFDDPKEAAYVAAAAISGTAKMFKEGQVTIGDWNTIVKTQMDVMGSSSSGAIGRFTQLTKIVENTNVRMSELAQQTEQLAKFNRQYGFSQAASNTMLVAFNEHLRSGAVSIQDMQTAMKGPSGAGEGVKALLSSQLSGSGGALGKAFQSTDVLGAIDVLLPDLMQYLESGKKGDVTDALSESFDGDLPTSAEDRKAMQGQIRGAYRGLAKNIVGTGGGEASIQARMMRLSPQLYGGDLSGTYGKGRENALGLLRGTDTPGSLAAGKWRPDADKSLDSLDKTYGGFKTSVVGFEGKVKDFGDYIAQFGKHVSQLEEEKTIKQGPTVDTFDDFLTQIKSVGTEFKEAGSFLMTTLGVNVGGQSASGDK